jgi:hypothetical protein
LTRTWPNIPDYLKAWEYERECQGHDLTVGDLVKGVKAGVIGLNDLATQLLRIGYTPVSVSLILANTLYDLGQMEIKQFEKIQKVKDAYAKALEQQIIKQQKKQKYAAQVNLDLEKAERKAQLILTKSKNREDLLLEKATEKDKVVKAQDEIEDVKQDTAEQVSDITAVAQEQAQVSRMPP